MSLFILTYEYLNLIIKIKISLSDVNHISYEDIYFLISPKKLKLAIVKSSRQHGRSQRTRYS